MNVTVDPEFCALIPPLRPEEYAQLEQSLLTHGCMDALVVWGDILLDGHNRLEICQKHAIKFRTVELDFDGREAAADWIDAQQLGRRNLTLDDFRLILGRRYNRQKRTHAEAGGMRATASVILTEAHTAEALGKKHGVSPRTVERAGKLAEMVEHVQAAEPDVVAQGHSAVIGRAKEILKPHVAHNRGDNEWYTPKSYIEAARIVMGKIELDPASSAEANSVVQAAKFYTAKDDGLKQDWSGRIWVNPPYAAKLIGKFIEKLALSVEGGDVTEALVLVNNATETKWFARLAGVSSCLCFPTGRVRFWHPRKKSAPLQGQALAYIGEHGKQFCCEFARFGIVVEIVR